MTIGQARTIGQGIFIMVKRVNFTISLTEAIGRDLQDNLLNLLVFYRFRQNKPRSRTAAVATILNPAH